MLAVALLLLVSFACLLAPSDVTSDNDTEAGTVQYSYDNLFKSGTVFNDHVLSYSLSSSDVKDIATGYLNNDGLIDVAVATSTRITIYYGTGDGALGNPTPIPQVMSDLRKIAVGDLDKDGKDDIAATYIDSSDGRPYIGIFYQKDSYSTDGALKIQTPKDPWQVVIGDFSHSGVNGLAVICRGDPDTGVSARLLVVKWPFTDIYEDAKSIEITGLTNLKLLAAGHVNSDGWLDLVVGNAYEGTLVVLTQPDSFGSSWSPVTKSIGGSIADIQFMDYSGSGMEKDLAVVKYGLTSNQVEVRINDGTIPTEASYRFSLAGASSLAVGRVTGGSYPDLIVMSSSENLGKLFPRQGGVLNPGTGFQFPVNTAPIKAIALEGGVYVLSTGSPGAGSTLEYYRYLDSSIGNADGNRFVSDGEPTTVCAGYVPFGIIAAIIDGQNAVYISDLAGTSRIITTSSVPTSLYIGDLDGDQIGDLAIAFKSSNTISIYKGSSGLMSNNQAVTISLPSSLTLPQALTGGRLEAIGKDILIVGCRGGVDIIYNSLSGSPVHEIIGTEYSGDRIDVAFGQLNSAGASGGIAALNLATLSVEIYYAKQSSTVGDCYDSTYSARLSMPGFTPTSMAVGDFDGNGRDDVAVTTNVGQMKVFNNTGTGFYDGTSAYRSITLPGAARQVRSGDLNDDGKDDLAVVYSSIAKIGIWLSKGSMDFSNSFDMTSGGIASGIFVKDLNSDQRDDILASSSEAKAVSYWFQRSLAPTAETWHSSYNIDEGGYVRFDASNSTDSASDASSLTYYWYFGDQQSSTEKVVEHHYTVGRTEPYEGYLLVTDRSGLTSRTDFSVMVIIPLEASFSASKYYPTIGETVHLYDTSFAPNGVTSWTWDMGDGRIFHTQNVDVSYDQANNYTVSLTVTDWLGKTATFTDHIIVLKESLTTEGIIANGGDTSFLMDDQITFEVIAKNIDAPIDRYAWDMNYDDAQGHLPDSNTTINRITWSYHSPGNYTIWVKIHDTAGGITQYNLTIMIMNSRPIADISASSVKPGNFTFDAGQSRDTASDENTLQFRWNFGNGERWTDWSLERGAYNNYTEDGSYTVVLEVRDQWGLVGSTTYKAIVDNGPPTIDLDGSILTSQAYRGEDLVVRVNVTDLSSVDRVLLIYTTNNETKTLVMTRVSGTDIYIATIPGEDVNGDLSFYVEAVDIDGHRTVTAAMSITLVDRPTSMWMFILIAAIAGMGIIFVLYYRARMVVDDVFIIYHDGNLMAHQTRRLKPGMDDQILGSMLVAIQEFVKDSFKDETSTGLNRMDFGEKKVLVEKGDHIYLAVVLHGKHEGRVPQRMKETISRAESDYYNALDGWDGDLEKVRGIKDETDPLLRSSLKGIMSSIPFIGKESSGPAEMIVCPYCEATYPAGEPKCPKCGTSPETTPSEGADGTGGPTT
jgi:PKD repeat protein